MGRVGRVRSCGFGGDALYLTTARTGLSEAGSLFACGPGVAGLPAGEWAG